MREELLGYLLGALDAPEQQKIEEQLDHDPELRLELKRLEQHLEPLATFDTFDPPAGLADRTLAEVFEDAGTVQLAETSYESGGGRRTGSSLSDLIFSGGICAVALMLVLPALAAARFQSQVSGCQWNLSQLGIQLRSFSLKQPDRRIPEIPSEGSESFAGFICVQLRDQEYLEPKSSLVVCPSSALADQLDRWTGIPSSHQIRTANIPERHALWAGSAGSLALNLGVMENGVLRAPRMSDRRFFVLLGDAPSPYLPNRISANHMGRGQNLLYEDLHVRFVTGCSKLNCEDDPYRNYFGHVEAGADIDDSVIADGCSRPLPEAPVDVRPAILRNTVDLE